MESRLLTRLGSSFFVRSSTVLARSLCFSTQVGHLQSPCRCSAVAVRFQPFESVSATTFQVSSGSIAIESERHALATHAGTVLSSGHFQAPGFMDTGDTASFVGWIASAVDTHHGE